MTKLIKTWQWAANNEGFVLELVEQSYWGSLLADFLGLFDMEWWGKYKNIPFCWINPWGWTWKIGTEDHNLGSLWYDIGQKMCNFQYHLKDEKLIKSIYVSDEEVKEKFPDVWDWRHYWDSEEDDE